MATNWIMDKYECMTHTERQGNQSLAAHPVSIEPMPIPQMGYPVTSRVEMETLPKASYARRKIWLLGLDVMFVVLAAGGIFYFLDVASFGFLNIVVTAVGTVIAVGLGHRIVWGRVWPGRRFE